jgi:exopolyphosphatase/guanosine-5'-triphosphate,3'-diphosphate pyrophosphatase
MHSTGRLDPAAIDAAIAEFRRFRALVDQSGATSLHAIATAAAREAENGPEFIERAEAILGTRISVLSGRQEAHLSALGIISGFVPADGIAGDLGGGSLELIDVRGVETGTGITLPLGGLRLQDRAGGDLSRVRPIVARELERAPWLAEAKGRTFYAIGGTWRNLARLHMDETGYPLLVMHHYVMEPKRVRGFLDRVAGGDIETMRGIASVSKNRRALLPYGAAVLSEIIRHMKPERIEVSAFGVREGYLYSLLTPEERALDPLIAAAEELALLRARSVLHARELADWTGLAFAAFGIEETPEEARYRRAACLLADIGWRAHPEYRGTQSLNIISHASFVGVDHPGRSYLALASAFRHEGIFATVASAIEKLATPRLLERARLLAAIMRVVYLLSASMPGVIPRLSWRAGPDGSMALVLPAELAGLSGERPKWRLEQLARLLDRKLELIVDSV